MIRIGTASAAAVATALSLTLAACGGGSEAPKQTTNTTAAPTTPAAPTNTTAAAPAPAAADTTTLTGATLAQFTGDAKAGETVFLQCKTCHVLDAGVNRIGPSLHNIVGRAAGTVAGYQYTPANKDSGITWTPEKLFQYLENPQRVVPGTKMAFAGIPDQQKRADLIAYLAAQGSGS